MLIIGKIAGFHGLNGEVKIPYSERLVKNLSHLEQLYIYTSKDSFELLDVENYRIHKTNILLKFKQYSTKTEVEHLKNTIIKQKEENLAPLEEEEYFIKDLIGLDVYDQTNTLQGKVNTVLSGAASNDILEIKTTSNEIKLLPFVEAIVKTVDIKDKKIIIHSIPGLLDDEI
jgi:16S rRNA processing protein RimM